MAIIEKDGTIKTLSERVRELETEQDERVRYQLAKLGTVGDFFAYGLRSGAELRERTDEPAHFLCQPCFDGDSKKIVLTSNGEGYWHCPICKHGAQTTPQDLSMFYRADDGRWD
ncbi:hypothetical protein J7E49_21865 [Variovorax paradoxus]|nr:hypothetical protein [Variovorax paradoxus]